MKNLLLSMACSFLLGLIVVGVAGDVFGYLPNDPECQGCGIRCTQLDSHFGCIDLNNPNADDPCSPTGFGSCYPDCKCVEDPRFTSFCRCLLLDEGGGNGEG